MSKDQNRDCLQCGATNQAPPEDDGVQLCDYCFDAEQEADGDPFELESHLRRLKAEEESK